MCHISKYLRDAHHHLAVKGNATTNFRHRKMNGTRSRYNPVSHRMQIASSMKNWFRPFFCFFFCRCKQQQKQRSHHELNQTKAGKKKKLTLVVCVVCYAIYPEPSYIVMGACFSRTMIESKPKQIAKTSEWKWNDRRRWKQKKKKKISGRRYKPIEKRQY